MDRDSNAIGGREPQAHWQRFAEVLLILLVFFVVGGDPPPHVNEPHYLGRLKHYWNPAWCAGDFFLETPDTQLVFIWMFGWVTRWLSLPATAWLGRFLVWTFLAWAWQRLSWRIVPRPLVAVFSAAIFVSLNDLAHMAGEWVVGGVEAKGFAYGFVLVALAELTERRWNFAWLAIGAATACHPLVGGWSGLVCGGIWLITERSIDHLKPMLPGLAGCAALAALGIVPALMLTWNKPAEVVAEASRVYVFERLPHHLALLRLPEDDVVQRLVRHGALFLAFLVLSWGARREQIVPRHAAHAGGADSAARLPSSTITLFALGAALIALVGLAIELVLWNQPLVAARLQRYYWYRLSDFAVPAAVALLIGEVASAGLAARRGWGALLLVAALVLGGFHLATLARERVLNPLPPADKKIRDFAAWVEVTDWIRENTPRDALFLTPRGNLSFKWRAGRPEVVNRKDIPQDARGIIEWQRRLKEIYGTKHAGTYQSVDSLGGVRPQRLRELAGKYGAHYVLSDRTQLIALPRVFWNEEYVVYRID